MTKYFDAYNDGWIDGTLAAQWNNTLTKEQVLKKLLTDVQFSRRKDYSEGFYAGHAYQENKQNTTKKD